MARVFTTNLNMASGSKWGELRLDVTLGTQNIANNTTAITYELYLQRTATSFGGYYSNYANSAALTINGTAISVPNFTYNFSTNYKKSIKTGSMTITHNADGKKTVSASASVSLPGGSVPGGSGSGSFNLTTIPRASSIGTISGNQIGGSITVNISRASTSFTHYVFYHLPGQSWQQVTTSATTSSTFTLPGSVLSFIPNATSGQLNIMIRTYSGGTRVGGDITKTHTVYVPVSTFTAPTSFIVGSAFTVNISRVATQLTHHLSLHDGSTALHWDGTTAATSRSLNVAANTIIARMSGVKSKAFTVRVDTYNGSTYIGSTSKSITANIPASTFTIPSSFNVGSAFTASISRVSSLLTNRIELVDGSTSLYLTDATSSTSLSTNVPANTVLARMSGVKSKAFTVHLHTYNNGVWIAYTSKSITASIPTSTFTAPTSFTMGSAFAVSISRVGSLTHAVELWDGGTNIYTSGNTVATSSSVNLALSTLAARSPNAMSRTFRLDVDTYNGNLFVGKSSKNITANVPASAKPTIETVTASENVSSVASLVGAYVQTKSKLNLAINGAAGIYGSTIRSFNITGVGHNSNSWSTVTGLLSVSGNQTITGTVTDTRGQTFSKSIVINILPYTAPTLSGLSFRRTLPDKTEAPLGDNATVSASVKVHSLIVNGVQKNSIKYQVQSAQSGGSFATKADTTSTDLTKSYSDVWVGYSVDHSYNFRVRVGDVFGFGGWSVGVVPTGVVTQQWSSKTTSFGKMIDNNSYNVQVGRGGIHSEGPIFGTLESPDLRHLVQTPQEVPKGVSFSFRTEASMQMSGAGYLGVMTWRAYGSATDFTGGPVLQIAYNSEGAVYKRHSTSLTAWSSWKLIAS